MVKDLTTSQTPAANSSEPAEDVRAQTSVESSDQSAPDRAGAAITGAVDVLDVTHAFLNHGTPLPVIDDVSLSVRPGTFVSLVGPSGSGKSTIARMAVGLIEPTRGEVKFDEVDIWDKGNARRLGELRRRFQMIFQDPYASLNPRLTIEDSIAFGPKVHGVADAKARTLARDLLARAGCDLTLDAGRVGHLGALALQLLIAAARRWRADGVRLAIEPRSPSFDDALGEEAGRDD